MIEVEEQGAEVLPSRAELEILAYLAMELGDLQLSKREEIRIAATNLLQQIQPQKTSFFPE